MPFPEDGYFKIKRGTNFCGIESSICYAAAVHHNQTKESTASRTDLTKLTSSQVPVAGGYVVLTDTNTAGVSNAKAHQVQHVHQSTNARRSSGHDVPSLSADPNDYDVMQVRSQVHSPSLQMNLSLMHAQEFILTLLVCTGSDWPAVPYHASHKRYRDRRNIHSRSCGASRCQWTAHHKVFNAAGKEQKQLLGPRLDSRCCCWCYGIGFGRCCGAHCMAIKEWQRIVPLASVFSVCRASSLG